MPTPPVARKDPRTIQQLGRVRTDEQVTERRIAAVELAKLEAEAA